MTIHIISVGLSIHNAIKENVGDSFDKSICGRADLSSTSLQKSLNAEPETWLSESGWEDLNQIDSKGSAELATFAAQNQSSKILLPEEDTAFLLASDTPEGLRAAIYNAYCLNKAMDRIKFKTLPRKNEEELPINYFNDTRGKIIILSIPGLDAKNQLRFENSMETLGIIGARIIHMNKSKDYEPEDIRIYLSGGFKVSIPFLIAFAEGLRAADFNVSALCLHESSLNEGNPMPISIPLRKLPRKHIESVVKNFPSKDTVIDKNPCEALTGYTHVEEENDKKRWRLTPFGYGLIKMYGKMESIERYG